jgi:CheY-like chemotaxis protein
VVLADVYMPGKNGYEVCFYVRQHPTLGATPVVLLVGAFDAFDEETAKKAGATANITKPFEPGVLTDLVMSVLVDEPATPAVQGTTEPLDDADLLGLAAIENMAWRVVPEIAEKIVREELKRTDESGDFKDVQP